MASFSFDASSVPATEKNFEVLPPGWYSASLTAAEVKQTKSGSGSYVRVEWTISGPTAQGRKVWSNYNTRNENPKAEEIGRQQFAELCRAIGVSKIDDTDELVGGVCSIKLKVREASGGYDAQNEIQSHKAIEGSAPPAAKPAAAKGPKLPWAK